MLENLYDNVKMIDTGRAAAAAILTQNKDGMPLGPAEKVFLAWWSVVYIVLVEKVALQDWTVGVE